MRRSHTGLCLAIAAIHAALLPAQVAPGPPPARGDLPLIEVAARAPSSTASLAVILSGDGGWAAVDQALAAAFAEQGIPVVGLDSRRYMMKARTPDAAGGDLEWILRTYLQRWNANRILLVGYSRGADVLPFMASRLPGDLRMRLTAVALIGPSERASFHFHWLDLVRAEPRDASIPVQPEIDKLQEIPTLCIHGIEDRGALCPRLDASVVDIVAIAGGHRLRASHAEEIASLVLHVAARDR